jgi:hypothetical protein
MSSFDEEASSGLAHAAELRKEAYTMALYVAVCLLAALLAIPAESTARGQLFGLIWGITIGLAAAHLFAFRISARLVSAGQISRHDVESGLAQLAGAAVVALLAASVTVVFPTNQEYGAVQFVLAGFIGAAGFVVSRRSGAGVMRAVVYGVAILVVAVVLALVKNLLAGH